MARSFGTDVTTCSPRPEVLAGSDDNEDSSVSSPSHTVPAEIALDRYRAVIFPNRIREQRRRRGYQKLMALSEQLPEIPYIRLSKIERGEVAARADELQQIANSLDIAPSELLTDVAAPGFDMAVWAQPFQDGRLWVPEEERVAVILAAALRTLRNKDRTLTIAALDEEYGLAPVILSRLENAYRTLNRWNRETIATLCRLFDVVDEAALREKIAAQYLSGELDAHVGRIADAQDRMRRTQQRIAALSAELGLASSRPRKGGRVPLSNSEAEQRVGGGRGDEPVADLPSPSASDVRKLPVYGAPLPGGLIAVTKPDSTIASSVSAGPRAYALRVCRATLGAGLPSGAVVVVDPDRFPVAGSLAAIRSDHGHRLVTVTFDRTGATKGYSVMPDMEIALDDLDRADVHAVVAAIFPA